jgi:anti-sigma B factor antagonist
MVLSLITRKCKPGVTVIELSGHLTLSQESGGIEKAVLAALNEGAQRIVIDLSQVGYVDSSGIGVIAYCFGKVSRKGAHAAVSGARGRVMDVFKLTRLDLVIPTFPDVASACEALAALASSAPSA